MPHPRKKRQRLQGHRCNNEAVVVSDFLASIESLSVDVLASIFGFLIPAEILHARLNKRMREAAKITIVPPTYELIVDSAGKCNAMSVMATALPNLQKITLGYLGDEHKYVDGEDPDEEEAVRTARYTTHDIGIIANFTNLRELKITELHYGKLFNGRYPFLFNFPHLQKLTILHCKHLKADLDMLAGLASLKELNLAFNTLLSGNINSLRALKDTLEKLHIQGSFIVEGNPFVKGNFMDLADFPHLNDLYLLYTPITGGIQDIGEKDFPSLKALALPNGGNGGVDQVFQRISDADDVIRIPYLFQKQRPAITLAGWYAKLSEDSPDWYDDNEYASDFAPKYISLVRAGNRLGYRWENTVDDHCEVNWLDPEPDRESSDYGKYKEELQEIEAQVKRFKGFYQPPTQEEFESIWERISEEIDNYSD